MKKKISSKKIILNILGIITKYILPLGTVLIFTLLFYYGNNIHDIEFKFSKWLSLIIGIITFIFTLLRSITQYAQKNMIKMFGDNMKGIRCGLSFKWEESVALSIILSAAIIITQVFIISNVVLITILATYIYYFIYVIFQDFPYLSKNMPPKFWFKRNVISAFANFDSDYIDEIYDLDAENMSETCSSMFLIFLEESSETSSKKSPQKNNDSKIFVSLLKSVEKWLCNKNDELCKKSNYQLKSIHTDKHFLNNFKHRVTDIEFLAEFIGTIVRNRISYSENNLGEMFGNCIYYLGNIIDIVFGASTKENNKLHFKLKRIINLLINNIYPPDNDYVYAYATNPWTKEQKEERTNFYIEVINRLYIISIHDSSSWFLNIIQEIYNTPFPKREGHRECNYYFISLTLLLYVFSSDKTECKIEDIQNEKNNILERISEKNENECWWRLMKNFLEFSGSFTYPFVCMCNVLNFLAQSAPILDNLKRSIFGKNSDVVLYDEPLIVSWWCEFSKTIVFDYPYCRTYTLEDLLNEAAITSLKNNCKINEGSDDIFNFFKIQKVDQSQVCDEYLRALKKLTE